MLEVFNLDKLRCLEGISVDGKVVVEEVRKLKYFMFDIEESMKNF